MNFTPTTFQYTFYNHELTYFSFYTFHSSYDTKFQILNSRKSNDSDNIFSDKIPYNINIEFAIPDTGSTHDPKDLSSLCHSLNILYIQRGRLHTQNHDKLFFQKCKSRGISNI